MVEHFCAFCHLVGSFAENSYLNDERDGHRTQTHTHTAANNNHAHDAQHKHTHSQKNENNWQQQVFALTYNFACDTNPLHLYSCARNCIFRAIINRKRTNEMRIGTNGMNEPKKNNRETRT